jgi:hypothetical protein
VTGMILLRTNKIVGTCKNIRDVSTFN